MIILRDGIITKTVVSSAALVRAKTLLAFFPEAPRLGGA
jgi:hypothetical protein